MKFNFKYFLVGIVLSLFLVLGFTTVSTVNAKGSQFDDSTTTSCNIHNLKNCPQPSEICGNGEHTHNPHCITPTATPTPTEKCTPTPTVTPTIEVSPSVSPSISPTPTEEITPTPTEEITPTVTPTETPSPTVTPTPTEIPNGTGGGTPPTFAGSTTNAPAAATCTIDFAKPNLFFFQAEGNGKVKYSWNETDTDISKFSVSYGYSPTDLRYGEDNIPATSRSIEIGDLIPGQNIFAQIWAWKNGCAELSNILDPLVK